jgi:two-component sensor histidine kinase
VSSTTAYETICLSFSACSAWRGTAALHGLPRRRSRVSRTASVHSFWFTRRCAAKNYRGVPSREIAEKLAQRLRNAWDVERRIALELEGSSAILDERQGFALALALNELLTNAFRHAFPNAREGKIRIRLADHGGELQLSVADDGVGSAAFQQSEVVGSGRSIVQALVRDELAGSVRFESRPDGTEVTITFPATQRNLG